MLRAPLARRQRRALPCRTAAVNASDRLPPNGRPAPTTTNDPAESSHRGVRVNSAQIMGARGPFGGCLRAIRDPGGALGDDPLLGVDRGRFCSGADFEFVVDVFKVLADRPGADEQRCCDRGVSLACRGPGQDDPFAWRQAQ